MNTKKYSHITKTERQEIAILLGKGYSRRNIAAVLGRNVSSISREIRYRKTKGKYDPDKAHHKARVRRQASKYQGMKVVGNSTLRDYVETKLQEDWSPEAISGRIKEIDHHLRYVSAKGIYKFVASAYGTRFQRHLAYQGRRRKSQTASPTTKIENRVFIDKRPEIVRKRGRFGDWEGDFIVSGRSGRGVLLVLHERKARYTLVRKITAVSIERVHEFLYQMTGGILMNTLTLDNDIVFRKHEEMSSILGVPVYFCHPYHSWEKGGVENTNKLIRRYVPKGSDISQFSDEYIQMVEMKLNARPRKCLRYRTPFEIMATHHQFKIISKFEITNYHKQKISSVALEGSG